MFGAVANDERKQTRTQTQTQQQQQRPSSREEREATAQKALQGGLSRDLAAVRQHGRPIAFGSRKREGDALADALLRVRTIYYTLGGAPPGGNGRVPASDFDAQAAAVAAALSAAETAVAERDALVNGTRDHIRAKVRVHKALTTAVAAIGELHATQMRDAGRTFWKVAPAMLEARRVLLSTVAERLAALQRSAAGNPNSNGDGDNLVGIPRLHLVNGELADAAAAADADADADADAGGVEGAGVGLVTPPVRPRQREVLTEEQQQALIQIHDTVGAQDAVLDEISGVVDELRQMAEKMSDELSLQEQMLERTDAAMTHTADLVTANADRMAHVLTQLRDRQGACCCYLALVAIIGLLAYIAYSVAAARGVSVST